MKTRKGLIAASILLGAMTVVTAFMFDGQQRILESSSGLADIQESRDLETDWLRLQSAMAVYAMDRHRVSPDYLALKADMVSVHIDVIQSGTGSGFIASHPEFSGLAESLRSVLGKYAEPVRTGNQAKMAAVVDAIADLNPVIVGYVDAVSQNANLTIVVARERAGELLWGMYIQILALIVFGVLLVILISVHNRHLMHVENALSRSKDAALKTAATMQRMLAASSHDLRQPLQSMLLFVDALGSGERQGMAERNEVLAHLRQGMAILKSLLDGLIDVARCEGGVEPRIKDFPVRFIFDEIEACYGVRARNKGIEFRVCSNDVVLRSDPVLLGRMVRNLVENALRHTITGFVAVSCRRFGSGAFVEVVDTGCGISHHNLEVIWDEFRQVGEVSSRADEGVGLGLSIVRSLAHVLGCPVSVSSRLGEGSLFAIQVPLGVPELAAGEGAVEPAASLLLGRSFETQTSPCMLTLVIDDDPLVIGGIECSFALAGSDLITAGSGWQALRVIKACGRIPDVIVSDYRLGEDETGIEAVTRVRAQFGKDIPALILTGNSDGAGEHAHACNLPLASKPIACDDLIDLLEKLVAQSRQEGSSLEKALA